MTADADPAAPVPPGPASERIDKWLFFSRIVKSRSLAAKLVGGGHVRVNGDKIAQPSRTVRPGDTLTLVRDGRVTIARIISCGLRRGPAAEARLLYEDLSPPQARKPDAPLDRLVAERAPGSGRPTKRDRRKADQLRDS